MASQANWFVATSATRNNRVSIVSFDVVELVALNESILQLAIVVFHMQFGEELEQVEVLVLQLLVVSGRVEAVLWAYLDLPLLLVFLRLLMESGSACRHHWVLKAFCGPWPRDLEDFGLFSALIWSESTGLRHALILILFGLLYDEVVQLLHVVVERNHIDVFNARFLTEGRAKFLQMKSLGAMLESHLTFGCRDLNLRQDLIVLVKFLLFDATVRLGCVLNCKMVYLWSNVLDHRIRLLLFLNRPWSVVSNHQVPLR